jgi:probable HAF family extracellular repeat protein
VEVRTLALLISAVITAGAGAPERSRALTKENETWTVVKLGTLGGTQCASDAVGINDRGQVIGDSGTGTSCTSHAFLWQNGEIKDLGTLGGTESDAKAISPRGDIIGFSTTAAGRVEADGFVWRNGRMTDLGAGSNPEAINRQGEVVGKIGAFRAFLWRNGNLIRIAPRFSDAFGIDNRGVITGDIVEYSGKITKFLWRDGRRTDLEEQAVPLINDRGELVVLAKGWENPLFQLFQFPPVINDRGQVAGICQRKGGGNARPCLWEDGRVVDLGTPFGGNAGRANAINDLGLIVGKVAVAPTGGKSVAFVWHNGTMTRLPTLHASDSSEAIAINDHNEIVGTSGGTAVLWRMKNS